VGELPSGTVTLLFTDIGGSTGLVKQLQERYATVLAEHRALLRAAFAAHGGAEVDTQGDSFFVAFGRARDAVACAAAAQRDLAAHPWPDDVDIAVRMGLHTGEPHRTEHGYSGLAVHRAARLCTLAHGGQALLSRSTAGIVDDEELPGLGVRDLGEVVLKDFERPERVFQLVIDGLPGEFPPLRSIAEQVPLSGTVTVSMVEGRRMMRLGRELSPELFAALLGDYRRLVGAAFERAGGRYFESAGDTFLGAFPTAGDAARAAVDVLAAVRDHDWPHGRPLEVSVGLHSGTAGVGWVGTASMRCADLCDAAEGGQIFLSSATAGLLEDEELGALHVRDAGEPTTRRGGTPVRAFELVSAA